LTTNHTNHTNVRLQDRRRPAPFVWFVVNMAALAAPRRL